jgi:hypothetical protein
MDKPDWNQWQQDFNRAIGNLRKFAKDDPARHSAIQEIKRMQRLLDEEDLPGQPDWVTLRREMYQKWKDLRRKAPPISAAIKESIENQTGRSWQKDLHIGYNLDLTYVGFDVWYESDEDLERDRSSGRHEELTEIMQRAAKQIADAESEVRFHSHQFVKEKYEGDYFRYFR